ncbi:transcription factor 7-like 1 isoform X2 [Phyllopteryx taeniolatus]|uniref:transcription factor 7-like 1 isoform X2 n=1 Tax=Phyllopteryx taeniolatus TaxID=161469 RepID=UPI002AD56D7C|nr:transcription factor 7-like 1 isoform X2 [Phyllopteryx taeniolatus]
MEDVVTLHEADWNDLLQVINNHDQQPWQVSAYLETVAATHQLPAQQILINSAPGLLMEVHPNPVRVINQLIPQTILAPTLPNSTSLELTQKKKLVTDDRPYIKKPLNAFLIFLKEHRANVKKIFKDKDSATVNKVLGQMWKSLTLIQKEKYFRESDRLNEEHVRKYPEWSCRDNYGKKRKRKWSNVTSSAAVVEAPRQANANVSQQDVCPSTDGAGPVARQSGGHPGGLPTGIPLIAIPTAVALPAAVTLEDVDAAVACTLPLSMEIELAKMLQQLDTLPLCEWPDLPLDLSFDC